LILWSSIHSAVSSAIISSWNFTSASSPKSGVKLISITQEMGDDPMHVMMRQIMALFDEYQSKENAKHVLRALKGNARQGFWNGSLPPIGYRVVAAEQRGAKIKKKLEIDPHHAETVQLAFRLALQGDGTSGSMGVKAIAMHLNRERIFTRDGGRWGVGTVHRMPTRATYIGRHEFNKRRKTKELNPPDEVIAVPAPPIKDQMTFDAVQAQMKARNPKVTPPQVQPRPSPRARPARRGRYWRSSHHGIENHLVANTHCRAFRNNV
jgi:site-specific DNA recombinase